MTVLKQKPLKGISASFHAHFLKIPKKILRKKSKQRKERSCEMLMLVLSGAKALKMFNFMNCTRQ